MTQDATTGEIVVNAALLDPLVNSVVNNLDVLLPVGLTIMGVMVGISLIPRIVYKFF